MRRAFTALVALTAIACLLPFAAGLGWPVELATHFRVQLIAGAGLLALVAALRRAWVGCGALVLCGLLNVPPLLPYLRPAPPSPPADGALTVLTVNVEARAYAHAGLRATIDRAQADVVLLVEITPRWAASLAGLERDYPHQVRRPRWDAYGVVLLSRYPLTDAQTFVLGGTSAIDARVMAPGGALHVVGVHLHSPTSRAWARRRNAELDELAARVQGNTEPLVVLGDFNTTAYSPRIREWMRTTGLREARIGRGLSFSWPSFFPLLGIPIDLVMLSPHLAVADYRRLAAFGSDHYPVLVRLVLEP